MRKVVVSASSMPAGRNMSAQIEYITRLDNYGIDMYHLDVMDGQFVKNKTLDYTYIEQLREKTCLLFDVHLMIINPEKHIDKYLKTSANIITVHYESFEDEKELINCLKKIKSKGKMAGLAIDLQTKAETIQTYLNYLDVVLIMSVKTGKYGQKFDNSAIDKIKFIRKLNSSILIEVDGGINDETAPQCIKAGADILVSGAYLYNNDIYDAIQNLKGKNK